MNLSDFDYVLPKELIAAYPASCRTDARLLVVDRATGHFRHAVFRDIVECFREGDLLVLNNTKVIPARIFGTKASGGKVEGLLLKPVKDAAWAALLKPNGRIRKGARIRFEKDGIELYAEVIDDAQPDSGQRTLVFDGPDADKRLKAIGHIPLPPYIDRPDTEIDRELYQTVYAETEGAVASPTAGLHFDQPLLEALQRRGVEIAQVTLHTGYGTFQPVACEDLSRHQMEEEEFEISEETAGRINRALGEGRRVIACGTTSVRTLESACDDGGTLRAQKGKTRLFVYPPYQFKTVSAMITNFHLPKSTLYLLVSAFLGRETLARCYEEAIREKYRFYSYGDAMVIL